MGKTTAKKSFLAFLSHGFNGLALALILYYGVWFTSAGYFPTFQPLENYYVNFSQALQKGQAALLDLPDPRLANLSDPHHAVNSDIPFLWDVSYFQGRYYIYWGPTPVIAYLLYSLARGEPAPAQIGLLTAYCGIACLLLALLYLLRWKFYPNAPAFSIGVFLIAACLNPPYSLLLSRPLTYETAILTGQMFLLLGVSFWVLFLIFHKSWLLVPAGFAWGLAVLARYGAVISVIIFAAVSLFYLWKVRPANGASGQKHAVRSALLLTLPLAVCATALGFYNAIRFNSPLETGLRYQLTFPVEKYYSPQFAATNLYVYLFHPNPVARHFPFMGIDKFDPASLPHWASAASGKQFDYGFFGLLRSMPILWFETLAGFTLVAVGLTRQISMQNRLPITTLRNMLLLAGLLQLVFLLFYYYSAVRFLSDFWLPLVFAGFLIFWEMDSHLLSQKTLRAVFWLVLVWACLQTALMGFVTGFALFPFYFAQHNLDVYYIILDDLNQYNRLVATLLNPTCLLGLVGQWLFP